MFSFGAQLYIILLREFCTVFLHPLPYKQTFFSFRGSNPWISVLGVQVSLEHNDSKNVNRFGQWLLCQSTPKIMAEYFTEQFCAHSWLFEWNSVCGSLSHVSNFLQQTGGGWEWAVKTRSGEDDAPESQEAKEDSDRWWGLYLFHILSSFVQFKTSPSVCVNVHLLLCRLLYNL